MIYGIGIDTIEVPRIERTIAEYGEQFLRRIYADEEIRYCQSRLKQAEHFAARFAAKEAFAKALGTGIRNGFRWSETVVTKERSGKPILIVRGSMKENVTRRVGEHYIINVSLTHTKDIAEAVVTIETGD
jgi:holo-[acyl-carrier protein] synthase